MNEIPVEDSCESVGLLWSDSLLLIHYWLPVALGWSLAMVFQRATGAGFSHAGLALLLAGIGAAYSFDRIVDAPKGVEMTSCLRRILLGGIVVCSGTIFFLVATTKIETRVLGVVASLTAASLVYSRLKRFPLLKTAVVVFAWTLACSSLPLNGSGCNWFFSDATLPLMLLLAAGCILCDLQDAKEDRVLKIPSLPVLLGIRTTCFIAAGLAFLAAILALFHHRFGIATGAILLALAAQFPALLARESIGPILIDSILIIPGVLISTGVV